ncbi:hypothetical protein, partial [Klebsiella pneumoniae]|uniref:hypothetical protein n=1 Tax=Klebsiella pneumoniae TaxID=573 RepID=UPI0024DEC2A1
LRSPDLKIVELLSNHLQKAKTVNFYEKCTKRTYRAVRSKFWQNLTFELTKSQNRRPELKSSEKSENSAFL